MPPSRFSWLGAGRLTAWFGRCRDGYGEGVLRLSLISLGAVVATLVVLALLPQRERVVPGEDIVLEDAQVTLYPQADPEAVWHFRSRQVDYNPTSRESVLYSLEDSERVVGGETDFTLQSDEVTIDAQDNLRGEQIFAHLIEAEWDLNMQGRDDNLVLIDQQRGKFFVPVLDYVGKGVRENHGENVSMNFDLTDFQADCSNAQCYNQLEDSGSSN